jgi:hypothetical protein
LGGRKVLWLIDFPKDFVSGNGTGRIYTDDAADARQRQELEAIFTGKKGGPCEVLGSLVTTWLPTQTATITIDGGDNPSITVGAVGHVKLNRIKDERGRATKLSNAPVLGAIQVDTVDLARAAMGRALPIRKCVAGRAVVMAAWAHSTGGFDPVSPSWA